MLKKKCILSKVKFETLNSTETDYSYEKNNGSIDEEDESVLIEELGRCQELNWM